MQFSWKKENRHYAEAYQTHIKAISTNSRIHMVLFKIRGKEDADEQFY